MLGFAAPIVAGMMIIGCADAGVTAPGPGPYRGPPPGVVAPIVLTTFDGSGEAVHPDPLVLPAGWAFRAPGTQWYLVATPYPGGNAKYENPSFYAGTALLDWSVPVGATNPVAQPATGYLSDPDQLYDPVRDEIRLYYRQVMATNDVWLIRSRDGVQWTAPELVLRVPNHQALSPTVVRRNATDWWMWTVNSGAAGCSGASTTVEVRRSTDGVTWSAPATAPVTAPVTVALDGTVNSGAATASPEFPWHLDVTWVAERGEFWAVYNAKSAGSCTTELLRVATSRDGVHWTAYPVPLLQRGAIPEFQDVVYRSSLAYDPASDQVTLWYSGARNDHGRYTWHIAVQQMTRGAMFAIVSGTLAAQVTPRSAILQAPSPGAAPLTNETAP